MANRPSLRKYSYTGKTAASKTSADAASTMSEPEPEMDMKTEILSSLKKELAGLFQTELKSALTSEFGVIKSELQAVKTAIADNTAVLHTDMEKVKSTVSDMERGLSACSDDVTLLQDTVRKLERNVESLQEKCLDMEGKMRRSNVRILNVAEETGSSSPSSVSKLLKGALKMDKDVLVDRSHRTTQPKRPDGKPRAIIAKLHYYQDCVEVLRRAREAGPLQYNGATIFVFPDYPPSVARARSAFNEVRKLLRGRDNIRYGILHPARLRITHNGTEKQFQDAAEAMEYVKTNII